MVHDIDQALWIGGDRAEEVTAQVRSVLRGGLPDLVFARVVTLNGQVWDLHSSWLGPCDEGNGGRMEVYTSDGTESLVVPGDIDLAEALTRQVSSFVEGVRRGKSLDIVTMAEALHGIAIADAIVKSGREGGAAVRVVESRL